MLREVSHTVGSENSISLLREKALFVGTFMVLASSVVLKRNL